MVSAMKASETQVGGTHYKDMGEFQPWDVLQHWLTPEEYRGYQKGVAIAYLLSSLLGGLLAAWLGMLLVR